MQLVKGGIDLELIEINRVSGLDGFSAEEDLVEGRVLGDSLEGFADAHASGQVFEVEVQEGLHHQFVGKVVDVRHLDGVVGKMFFADDSEMRGSSADDDVSCLEIEKQEC